MKGKFITALLGGLLIVGAGPGLAQGGNQDGDESETLGGLTIDRVSTAAILEATTDEKYLTPWVSQLPDHPDIPSPRDFLGRIAGEPGELTHVRELHGYMRALAASSDRAIVVSLGESAEGREMIAIVIADAQTIANIDQYKGYLNALADPRATDDDAAAAIIAKAKPIYWITAGLHSPELGPPEMTLELAYRLVAEEREVFRAIRANVITMITPVLEVDGRTRQVEWYYRHIKGVTEYADLPPRSSPFWGKYTYHDNNRDGLGLTQPLTRNFLKTYLEWKPTLSLDMHESLPLLYVATGTGPYNTGVSPITVSEWQAIAQYEVSRLTAMGLEGVWTWGFYTGWYPGYLLWVTNNRNSNGRFYETFGNGSAETMRRDLSDARYAGEKVTSRQWYRVKPPEEEVLWSMRNNINYMQSGAIASLEFVSRNGRDLVENYYRKGVESIEIGRNDPPHAIIIPAEQRDRGSARSLIDLVIRQGIEVQMASADATYGEIKIEKGDAVIKLDQPYGPFARTLFENQEFPEKAKVPPYDDVAWTLGVMRGVDVKMVDDAGVLDLRASGVSSGNEIYSAGSLARRAKFWVVPHRGQERLGPFRFALGGARVLAAREEVSVGRKTFPAGTLFIDAGDVDRAALTAALGDSLLEVNTVSRLPDGDLAEVNLPRIAMLHSWTSTQDTGWLRYTFDQAGIPFDILEKDQLQAGNLRADYDVIIAPSYGGRTSLARLVGGVDPKWSPLAYNTTDETPSHGHIVSSDDITGGMGYTGLAAIQSFMNEGGTLIGLGSGGVLVVDSGMVHGVSMSRPAGMNTPGSIIRMKITGPSSPLTFGYDEITHAFRGNTPLLRVSKDNRALVVAQFGTKPVPVHPWQKVDKPEEEGGKEAKSNGDGGGTDKLVLSGAILKGKEQLNGAPAILTKPVGEGQVVLFGWNPMHRHLNHHDHAFVYNALMFWNDLK